ncbi:trigger factor [Dolosigranulum pigrum]|jgi:trigger factor|uniref:Trigger factor n=1 Tax=Dolosigranulum pigrum TaxID=29394 RepID=A0A1S8KMX4_9LACT|nr:trigger factor [Dolosigranulum pigrum]OOL81094.1 trigger factor [Dolosigranulum pigrum]QTJ34853.1 trigger factor [Dolosigranulum pigrum]QTJ40023.1 trigger factor [Dolosigranulum pigrum]QTJ48506.1 trigger factor [Dolosigranulum pigrum]RAN52825.1 trigger factor [Dolosigranulum pigrum]
MTATFEKKGPVTGQIEFTIERATIEEGLDRAFKKIRGRLNVPGFRKGKVPRKLFNKMYGEEALYEDALNDLLPRAYQKALAELEDEDFELVGEPSIDIKSMEKDADWEIIAEVPLKPEVTLGDYKNIEVTKQDRTVTDEDVADELESRRQRAVELALKDDAAEEGDTVVIDFEGYKDGEKFDGGSAENHSLELGSGQFIPGFEDQLIGAKSGDEKDVEVTFPEEYGAEELAGQDVVFKVVVHEVKEKRVPELDDEFAKDVDDEVETLDELKDKIRQQLEKSKDRAATEATDDEAIQKAVENAEVPEIPEAMIDEEVDRQFNLFINNLQQQGISKDQYMSMIGTSEQELRDQFRNEADFNVKTNLVLEAIAKAENIDVTTEDINAEIKDLAEQYGMEEDRVRGILSEDLLKHDISLKKSIDLITTTAEEVLEPVEASDEDSE